MEIRDGVYQGGVLNLEKLFIKHYFVNAEKNLE
jgi:hypothetical protein